VLEVLNAMRRILFVVEKIAICGDVEVVLGVEEKL
jgi:hypothetical protein